MVAVMGTAAPDAPVPRPEAGRMTVATPEIGQFLR
jgi:hypothetical protein